METLAQSGAILFQVAMGVSLAACAGLRAFLPLFVVGVAGRLDYIPLLRSFEWLESWPALVVLGVAVVCELLADKIPAVDHFLDALQVWVKPIAGAILMASVLTELSPFQATVLGLMGGGAVATGVHLTKAQTRLMSTVTTAGFGNPLLSFIEDAVALVGSLAAMVVPFLVVAILILLLVAGWTLLRRRLPRTASAGTRS